MSRRCKLFEQRANPNGPQADGATALHWVAHWDDPETVDMLIRAGANPDAATELGVAAVAGLFERQRRMVDAVDCGGCGARTALAER